MPGVRIRIVATGETGTVIAGEAGGDWLIQLDGGGTKSISGTEKTQLLLPGWSLGPVTGNEDRP